MNVERQLFTCLKLKKKKSKVLKRTDLITLKNTNKQKLSWYVGKLSDMFELRKLDTL